MTMEQQVDRSVLESKARDELIQIAHALSLKPSPRRRKADLIDDILQAVTSNPEPNGAGPGPIEGEGTSSTAKDEGPVASNADSQPSDTGLSLQQSLPLVEPGSGEVPVTEAGVPGAASIEPASNGASGSSLTQERVAPAASQSSEETESAQRTSATSHVEQTNGGSLLVAGSSKDSRSMVSTGSANGLSHTAAPARFDQGGDASRKGRRRRGRERPGRDQSGAGSPEHEQAPQGEPVAVRGLLDLKEEGYGFLRTVGYLPSPKDVYVSISQARRFGLRKGDEIAGFSRPAASNEKYPALIQIESINGMPPEEMRDRPRFEELTPLFPNSKLRLEIPGDPANLTARIVDLLSPIGKGQRGLIVSPPKAGKTTIMKQIAHSIEVNNPEVNLIVLLVDERPEEVTDMRRSVKGDVVASTFDRPSEEHTVVAELTLERARRLVELGRDVVIILDGITRLARAYNLAQPATGRIMSGGVDSGALYPPKRFFGAARNIEEGGSLTILATALVETGSKMDEVIFEEFKGTGNMELRLDRRLAERRIYPAIDVNASSTRHEELLFDRKQLEQVWKLRRVLNALGVEGNSAAGLELLMDKIRTTPSNDAFLTEIAKSPTPPV